MKVVDRIIEAQYSWVWKEPLETILSTLVKSAWRRLVKSVSCWVLRWRVQELTEKPVPALTSPTREKHPMFKANSFDFNLFQILFWVLGKNLQVFLLVIVFYVGNKFVGCQWEVFYSADERKLQGNSKNHVSTLN